MSDVYEKRLQAFTGRELRPVTPGPDPVNVPMIRHWAEAMGDSNRVHLDDAAARAAGRPGVVAPASMIQAWTMPGYAAATAAGDQGAFGELTGLLAEGGYTSVVATDSELEFFRELVPGDHISVTEVVEAISPQKTTALGEGRFVTTLKTYTDAQGGTVATQRWRTLRFRPRNTQAQEPPALRPRPALNSDNAFWFAAAREHRLVIQRCTGCGALRHPTGPCCPDCHSFDWDTVGAAGGGTVHSFTVNHHPRHPAFDFPLVVAVVELTEGTRLIAGLTGVEPSGVHVGMDVVLDWTDPDPELSLPVFRPLAQEEAH
ncbi:MaoC family dehydratase N-terminal domain-containing protein [Streptomyces sp. NBC_01387]|uniref:bifunctional MaoC family dehydratase N-terminal/OB-fold nucleic acid binding domain-containing protein n=1 Tax=unclassified Streptomyces TaxID=2593676 RepID=UPI0020244C5B|nr:MULTISPECIES: MaoC family dehydratase N-terminal domain-containing protein [unclassified Streptomyces]MCX4552843.1 MaoC family dehydratase N-terminal domain-containing protein [Streptomyces sp. NBC_01500]WSC24174.1 MaoC family dehydratase N-terminal domain-containing protein [Streptomyces sp. NBC_01766]WSV58061.1 MaoC family dehydratase N-terminal domain-containing protein [Streptomyces sp. NBC_01014]